MAELTDPLADGTLASEGMTFTEASSLGDGLTFSETYAVVLRPGGVLVEGLHVGDTASATLMRRAAVNENLTLQDRFTLASFASILESMNFHADVRGWYGALIQEGFTLNDLTATAFTYRLTMTQQFRVLETYAHFMGVSIADAFTMTMAQGISYQAHTAINETISYVVSTARYLVARITYDESFVVEDAELLRTIYNQVMSESFTMELLYQSLGNNITSWVVNTRTNAVTEYQSFAFNSFAQRGNKYLAADANGLYELNGALDVTEQVIARFGSGYFQPNSNKLAGLKGVYLGVQGRGSYLLKIITGDGIERVYRTIANPGMMTTKVDIGKGINARYMAWELINEQGQDFDFDDVEFIPMMRGRRV